MIGWLVDERGIESHVKLMDKSELRDGALSRRDFAFDPKRSLYIDARRRALFSGTSRRA
jgi:hypothetical protein